MLLLTGEICEDGSMPRLSIGIPAILPDGASELTAESARPNSTCGYSYLQLYDCEICKDRVQKSSPL
jgi:hypothetical protein